MAYNVGDLDRVMLLQSRPIGGGAYGQPTDSWLTVRTFWARRRAMKGDERRSSHAMQERITHTIMVRYTADLLPLIETARWRILDATPAGDQVYNIHFASDVEDAHQFVRFEVSEGGADAH